MVAPRCDAGSSKNSHDQRMPFERLLHDAALHAAPAPVDQPYLPQAGRVRLVDVLIDDRRDIARRKRVEIERAFDRNPQWVLILHVTQ